MLALLWALEKGMKKLENYVAKLDDDYYRWTYIVPEEV